MTVSSIFVVGVNISTLTVELKRLHVHRVENVTGIYSVTLNSYTYTFT